jgi:hypothetical protein
MRQLQALSILAGFVGTRDKLKFIGHKCGEVA